MRFLALLLLSVTATSAFALPTLEDVEHAVHRNDYVSAESMTREVVTAQPNSAKPHYILAEILAHEGKLNEARTQAAQAKQLDPAIRFTTPEKFARFETELNGGKPVLRNASAPPRKAESSGEGGSSFLWIVRIVGGLLAFFAFRRRSAPPSYGAYNNPNAPMPGQPGYPNYPQPGYPPPGSGTGHTVAAGLGGLAAGMLAEHLIEGAMDRRHDANGNPIYTPQGDASPNETVQDRPIDFGGSNDWGSDSGSGGGDSGGGFDGGGSSDWS